MIFDTLMNLILAPIDFLISLIPDINISIPSGVLGAVGDVFGSIGYITPWKTVITILSISFALVAIRITWAIIIRVKSFIPTMGA